LQLAGAARSGRATSEVEARRPQLTGRALGKFEGVAGSAARVYALFVSAAIGEAAELDFTVELEKEADGRWIAEVLELPGVLAYGDAQEDAVAKAQALALRVVADRLEHGEAQATLPFVSRPHERVAERPSSSASRCTPPSTHRPAP